MSKYTHSIPIKQYEKKAEKKPTTFTHLIIPNNATKVKTILDKIAIKKVYATALATALASNGKLTISKRVQECCNYLITGKNIQSNNREIIKANSCKHRLCPMCIKTRARNMLFELSAALNNIPVEHECLHLVLTVKNPDTDTVESLQERIKQLNKAYNRLIKQPLFKKWVIGTFKAIEVKPIDNGKHYHPHIHCLLVVKKEYVGQYSPYATEYALKSKDFALMWQKANRVNYTLNIKVKYSFSIKELAKYVSKPSDYILLDNPLITQNIVSTLDKALYHQRLSAYTGILKKSKITQPQENTKAREFVDVLFHYWVDNEYITTQTKV